MSEQSNALRGGEFLIRETSADAIFIPEEWTEEQLMMKQMTLDFVEQRIIPNLERIEQQEDGLVPKLMEEAGELGLIGSSVPEELGGMGLDFKSTMLITEAIGGAHSFSVSFSAHTGIGTLPILYSWIGFRTAQRMLLPHGAQRGVGRQQWKNDRQAHRGWPALLDQRSKNVDHKWRIR